jgi:uncharacterized damage-inducible protein DinB
MTARMLEDAFHHHVWATLRVFDVGAELTPEQLATAAPGTYGSILDTLRHIVAADNSYLFALTRGRVALIDEAAMDLPALRAAFESYGPEWDALLVQDLDPDEVVVRHRDDGSETHAPVSIRLAQVLHHGTDHRSQLCTAFTSLGIEPPAIDVWDFGWEDGRVIEMTPTA